MLVRLTMICCGMTAASRRGFFPADEPLEDNARVGLSALAAQLDSADRVWTSPALRARQTAEALGLSAMDKPLLRDQDFGTWSGRAFDDVHRLQPDEARAWLVDPEATPPNGETFRGVAERAAFLFGELGTEDGHTIAFTHPAIIRAAILHVLQAPLTGFRFIDVEPLSLTDFRSDGARWQLRACGVTTPKARRR